MDTLTHIYNGFAVCLQPINLWYTFLGCFLGTIIGVLPGIGPSAGIALLIPVTYGMNPTSALIMMSGIFYGARYGGMIVAVTVWTCIYYAVFDKLGYVIATTVYLLALMAWFNRGKWVANVLTAVLFSVLSYIMFVKLDVNLPRGVDAVSGLSEGIVKVVNSIIGLFKPAK